MRYLYFICRKCRTKQNTNIRTTVQDFEATIDPDNQDIMRSAEEHRCREKGCGHLDIYEWSDFEFGAEG